MPERLSYDEAMRFAPLRLRIKDAEINAGAVETLTISTKSGKIIQPWGIEGGFAVVYKFRTRSGKFRALRCFRRNMDPDTQFRYERIGPYFQAHAAQITADFKYHAEGILIKESVHPQGKVYPVVDMEWIEGATLLDTVDELCQKRDQAGLRDLGRRWLALLRSMQQARIAHGDLAGGNVMVRRDGSLVLIDYDGVFIPDFATHQLRQTLLGQQDYQHPQMNRRPFNEHTDAFSALTIYTVLLILSWQPELWDRYTGRGPDQSLLDTNLLLKQLDFQEPQRSALFKEFERCSDPLTRVFVQELKNACLQDVEKARFPFHLIEPEKHALEVLVRAVQSGSDGQIVAAWEPVLEQYAPAQVHRSRVELARQRVAALQQWREAQRSQRIARVAGEYTLLLDECKDITPAERKLLSVARNFMQAFRQNDEDGLLKQREAIQQYKLQLVFTAEENVLLDRIGQRRQKLARFAKALVKQELDLVARAYQALLPNLVTSLSAADRHTGQLASAFLRAYQENSDPAILKAYDRLLQEQRTLTLQPAQQQRIVLARQCQLARERLVQATLSRNLRAIASAYDPILEKSTEMKKPELQQVALIRQFIDVYDSSDDKKLLEVYAQLKAEKLVELYPLTSEEQQRLSLAHRRIKALHAFRAVLRNGEPRSLVASYDRFLLENYLSEEEEEVLTLAVGFVVDSGDDTRFLAAYRLMLASPYAGRFKWTQEDRQRLEMLMRYEQQLAAFAALLKQQDAFAIIDACEQLPVPLSENLTIGQRKEVALAQEAITMRAQIRQAISEKKDTDISRLYRPSLVRRFPAILTRDEQTEVESALKLVKMNEKSRDLDYRHMLKLAGEIQRAGGLSGHGPRLRQAMRRVLRETRLTGVQACIQERGKLQGNALQVQWIWPQDELIKYVCIFWDPFSSPRVPSQLEIIKADGSSRNFSGGFAIEGPRRRSPDGSVTIDIDAQTYIYTKVYAAMYDEWDSDAEVETWCFSSATEFLVQIC